MLGHTAYIGLGSNLDDPAARLTEAADRLRQAPGVEVVQVSRYYATPPVGVTEQPWFVNAVAEVQTSLTPQDLLTTLLTIEFAMGRVRQMHWGPRVIDLDLLLYDEAILEYENLVVPHPEMHRRGFVLVPLAELAPQVRHPRLGKTVVELLAELAPEARVALPLKGTLPCTDC